jgi:hypothetical protein
MRSDEFISENLKQWFKEKWVRFGPDGKIRGDCARGSESEGKPKCLPQSKAQALGKKGRASAAAKKRREDPNPERRGPAKNVATKVKENAQGDSEQHHGWRAELVDEISPITFEVRLTNRRSGESANFVVRPADLIRLGMAGKLTIDSMDIQDLQTGATRSIVTDDPAPWVYILDAVDALFHDTPALQARLEAQLKAHQDKNLPMLPGLKKREHAGQGIAVKDFFAGQDAIDRAQGKKDLDEACWKGYHKEGMKTMFGKRYPNCVKNKNESLEVYVDRGECPGCGGDMVAEDQINEKQDACYHKVKSRYKVWPSAYASGALVQCRKKGASNWGNKSESAEQEIDEKWSQKYKSSINCANPKGFSQKAHCAGKKKHNESMENMMDELDRILELSGAGPTEQEQEFDLIESIIDDLAVRNGVDAEMIWEDLESLTDDELYVFAVTTEPVMEDWQKANKKDRTAGMSQKAVNAYRRENPGSKLKTAVTTKPSKLKKGSKASKRRKSYCSRSKGQMNMHNISCAKTPDKAICKARRRWNC